MANFLGILQSEWAGAQAFSSFDTFLAPYAFKDQADFTRIKKDIRSFVYNLNVPSRWGQSPFTNVTIDWTVPRDLRDQAPFSGGEHLFEGVEDPGLLSLARERGVNKLTELTYKHFQKEMNLINKAFYEVLTEGDSTGSPSPSPSPPSTSRKTLTGKGKTCRSCLKTPPRSAPPTSRTSSAASTP